MPVPSAMVTRFFQLLVNRQFAESERELERLKQRMHRTEWNRGYFRALRGMLSARRSNNDGYPFLSKLDFNDKKALQGYRREFLDHRNNKLHADFDRGFFSAWADCMRVLSKIIVNNPEQEKDKLSKKEEPETLQKEPETLQKEPETLQKNESQVTIESFLKKEV